MKRYVGEIQGGKGGQEEERRKRNSSSDRKDQLVSARPRNGIANACAIPAASLVLHTNPLLSAASPLRKPRVKGENSANPIAIARRRVSAPPCAQVKQRSAVAPNAIPGRMR